MLGVGWCPSSRRRLAGAALDEGLDLLRLSGPSSVFSCAELCQVAGLGNSKWPDDWPEYSRPGGCLVCCAPAMHMSRLFRDYSEEDAPLNAMIRGNERSIISHK